MSLRKRPKLPKEVSNLQTPAVTKFRTKRKWLVSEWNVLAENECCSFLKTIPVTFP